MRDQLHLAASTGSVGTTLAIVFLSLLSLALVVLVIVLAIRGRRAAARAQKAEKDKVQAQDAAAGAQAEAAAGRMTSTDLLAAVNDNLDKLGPVPAVVLAVLVAAAAALCPVSALADPGTPVEPAGDSEAATESVVVLDEVETPTDYFTPYLLRTGDTVKPAEVFGFHRHDVERIYTGQERLKSCRKNLDECLDVEPPPKPIVGYRWGWLEMGIGVAAGAAATIAIVYGVQAATR